MLGDWADVSDIRNRLQARRREHARVVYDHAATLNTRHFALQRLRALDAVLDDLERHEMCSRQVCTVCDRV